MVPTWKRKTERQNWNVEAMASAIDEARSGRLGYRSASKKYGVPRSTLERRVKNKNKIAIEVTKSLGSKQRIFPDAMEADFMLYILRMEELYFGLTLMDLRQIAEQNGIPNLPPALTVSTQKPANSQEPPALTVAAPPPANNEEPPALAMSASSDASFSEAHSSSTSSQPSATMVGPFE